MLTAEENVVLPLTIAGEKPEKEWREELLKTVGLADRRSHRPAELSGGQQQRVAIARALISRPTVVFADEPTGNLDSKTGSEILELLRGSVESLGQTTVMVTHDPYAAAIADRILFLGRRPDRPRHAALRAQRRDRGDGRAHPELMLAVALKGLAGRKVRALLTAIAIILGVAMISGTYILTDTINSGFNTIFDQSYKNADVVVTGKAAFDSADGNDGRAAADARVAPDRRCRSCRTSPLAAGSVTTQLAEADRQGREGDLDRRRAVARLLRRHRAGQPFNPTKLTAGHLAARQPPGRDRQGDGLGQAASTSATRIGVQAFGPARQMRITGIAEFPNVSDRRRDLRDLRPAGRAAALQQARPARRDPRPVEARRQASRS